MSEMVRLGDVCESKISTLSSNSDETIEYIDISSVDNILKKIVSTQILNTATAPSRAKQLINYKDILVSTVRPNLNAVAMVDINSEYSLVASTGYCVLRCNEKADSKYVFYFCQSKCFVDSLVSQATGASYPAVSTNIVKNTLIPLPPLCEQHHIAAVLDKVSELIALRKRQLDLLDEMVKARFVEMFGDFKTNPNGYSECCLSDVCRIGSSKRIYQNELQNDGVPFLRISDLMKRIISNFQTCDLYISKTQYDDLVSKNLVPKAGEILVTSRGTLGECYIIKDDDYFYFQDGMISWIYDLDKKVLPIFIVLLFKTHFIKDQIDKYQSGSTVAYLSIAMLKKIKIIVPPIVLQTQFADFVQQVEKTKATVQQGLDRLNLLKSALMQEYFG